MIRINIICEGQTEERFVKDLLYAHLFPLGILVNPIGLRRGDSYQKYKRNVLQTLRSDPKAYVTSMVDLYGMSEEFPGYAASRDLQPHAKAQAIEEAIHADITSEIEDSYRFIPYVQLHEFEALLFSDAELLESSLRMDADFPPGALLRVREAYLSPEHINDNRETAPSKRILSHVPYYSKTADGILIAIEIGINKMQQECAHFNRWVERLGSLSKV